MHNISRSFLCLMLLGLLWISTASAQDNATINGTVTDQTGALVPHASITLTNPATEQSRTSVSNDSGAFRFANVGVGTYALTVSASGFVKYSKSGIVVNVAQTLEENIKLDVGSQSQSVTVEADTLQVQTETNEVSNLITGEQVSQLATNGRNVENLAILGMGISNSVSDFNNQNANTTSNSISFNGTRSSHNVYLLDGAELNDRGCGGCFDVLPSLDALAEFQTLTSNYAPDYGLGSGGQIAMVIKSGTHNFHGTLWEFNRNEDYDANNYFTKLAGQSRPELRLNEPGGNIGGPLWIPHVYNDARNRTFFFVNEEWRRLIIGSAPSIVNDIATNNFPTTGSALAYAVPSNGKTPIVPITTDPTKLALYATDGLTAGEPFPNNTIPANLIDQNAVLELNAGTFPKPNYNNGTQYISSKPQPTDVRDDIIRIDHTINDKLQLMGHYVHDAVTQTTYPPLWGDSSYPTAGSTMTNPAWMAAFKLTQTYSPDVTKRNQPSFTPRTTYRSSQLPDFTAHFSTQLGGRRLHSFRLADNVDSKNAGVDLGLPPTT